MLKIYRRIWAINWAEQWQYRANLLMYLAYWLVFPIVYLTVWSAIAAGSPGGMVQGMTSRDFAAYYLTMLTVDIATSSITIHILASRIQDGTIANELLRPVHPILTGVLVHNLAFKALQMIIYIPVWVLLAWVFDPALTYTVQSVLLAIPALALGFLLAFLLQSTTTLLAFWTTRVYAVDELVFGVARLFNGVFVPLTLLPMWMQSVASALPFRLWISFPTLLLLNKLSSSEIITSFVLQGAWIVILFAAFHFVWQRALKRFSAVGA